MRSYAVGNEEAVSRVHFWWLAQNFVTDIA